MRQRIFGILLLVGVVWMLGLVGSLECDTISFAEFFTQGALAVLVTCASLWLGGFTQ